MSIPPRILALIEEVAREHETDVATMIGPCRRRIPSYARFCAYYRIRQEILFRGSPPSFPQIGSWFGGRDHSSIVHGYKKAAGRMTPSALGNVRPVPAHVARDVMARFSVLQAMGAAE